MPDKALARAAIGGASLLTFGILAALTGDAFLLAFGAAPLAAFEPFLRDF